MRELFNEELTVTLNNGMKLRTMRNNFVGLFAHVSGQYEPDLIEFMESRLSQNGVFVDVGANVGIYSLSAARVLSDRGAVVAIEAHPYIFKFLEKNLSDTNGPQIFALNVAAGHEAGEIGFRYETGNSGSSHVSETGGDSATVPVRKLDNILEELGIGKVSYLKIDVEGFEHSVLRGAEDVLKENPDIVLQTEIDARHLRRYDLGPDSVVQFLRDRGFVPHILRRGEIVPVPDVSEICYGDFIWARRKLKWVR